jgi:hypothetical protein
MKTTLLAAAAVAALSLGSAVSQAAPMTTIDSSITQSQDSAIVPAGKFHFHFGVYGHPYGYVYPYAYPYSICYYKPWKCY